MFSSSVIGEKLTVISERLRIGSSGRQIIRSASGSFIVQAASLPLSLISSVLLARFLGPIGFGYYAFAFAWLEFFKVPVAYGHPLLVQREIAIDMAAGRWGLVRGLLIRMNQAVLLVAGVLITATIITIEVFHTTVFGNQTQSRVLECALIMLPLIGMSSVRTAALNGLHLPVSSMFPDNILRPIMTLVVIVLLKVELGSRMLPQQAMLAQALAVAVAFGCGVILLKRAIPQQVKTAVPAFQTKEWMKEVWPFMLTGGAYAFWGTLGTIMLGYYRSPAEIGIFRVTSTFAGLALMPVTVANIVIAPTIAKLFSKGHNRELQKLITISTVAMSSTLLILFLCFFVLGRPILRLSFGEDYVVGFPVLMVLVTGHLLYSTIWTVLLCLDMTGHQRYSLYALFSSAALNIILAILLIPMLGAMGAAIATSTSWFLGHLWLVPVVRHKLRLRPTVLSVFRRAHWHAAA